MICIYNLNLFALKFIVYLLHEHKIGELSGLFSVQLFDFQSLSTLRRVT